MNNMNRKTIHRIVLMTALGIISSLFGPAPVKGGLLYKSYIVQQDMGVDILCDPYVVQRDDYVMKLFRQRGEIAEKDFPEFLELFRRLNPHISDINLIQPGQHIYIPLKKLEKDMLVGQDTGVVTIPFVTVANVYEFIKNYSDEYTVKKGDYVSKLITRRYGKYGTTSYKQGLELFKLLNPQVKDLDRIYPGQALLLPEGSLRNQPWFASLFDSSGRITDAQQPQTETNEVAASPTIPAPKKAPKSPMARVADILDGNLKAKGNYFIPRQGMPDLKIDLSRSPILELENGSRIVLLKENMSREERRLIESQWKDTRVVPLPSDGSVSDVLDAVMDTLNDGKSQNQIKLSDNGLKINVQAKWIISRRSEDENLMRHIVVNVIEKPEERTPGPISEYLAKKGIIFEDIMAQEPQADDLKTKMKEDEAQASEEAIPITLSNARSFVRKILMAMGVRYSENVKIMFPYVGIQVEATSNLISMPDGTNLIVDFEDLYGDAVSSIEKTGLRVVQIKKDDAFEDIIESLLKAMNETYRKDPTFYTSKRPDQYNTALTIPGFLVKNAGYPDTLLAHIPLDHSVIDFLQKTGINIIMIDSETDTDGRNIG